MSDTQRTLALSAFHSLLAATALAPLLLALVAIEGTTLHPAVALALLAYLVLVTWLATHRARLKLQSKPRSLIDAYITAGARWGGIGGALYLWGLLGLLFVWGVKTAPLGPEPDEYALVGGKWAFLWLTAILVPLGGAIGFVVGAIPGGVIAIIDRTLLPIANWIRATPNSR